MKKITALILAIMALLALLVTPAAAVSDPLDEILDYTITVDMRNDGTMDIRYDIAWKVLDSTSEGPLEWVKIGCPNNYVDEITSHTRRTIKKISYMSESGKSYIRVDFQDSYQAGEVVTFSYSIHQSRMYILEEDAHICRYSFTPGWFDEIDVDKITIRWNAANVLESTADYSEKGWLIWTGSLSAGERLNASVRYNLDVFDTNPDEQYTEGVHLTFWGRVIAAIIIFVIIVAVVAFFIWLFSGGNYGGGRGFGGGHTVFIHTGGCASCASCAGCAGCACAGGGRAGCSLKDFYHTNLQTDLFKKALGEPDE